MNCERMMKPDWQKQHDAAQQQMKKMNEISQKQQQMLQRQQELSRKQMQQMHEMTVRQQKSKQKQASSEGNQPNRHDEFTRVERETNNLKQALSSGKISQEAFDQSLKELMISDNQGCWWMLGSQTNTWYRFDGASWVVDTPPGRHNPQAVTIEMVPPVTEPISRKVGFCYWFRWTLLTLIASTIATPMATLIGGFRLLSPNILNNHAPGILVGLVLGVSQMILLSPYVNHSYLLLLGYLISGAVVGMIHFNFSAGAIMGLGNSILGFLLLRKNFYKAGLFLFFRPLILGLAWSLSWRMTIDLGSRPWGADPMLELVEYGVYNGFIAGLVDGMLVGLLMLIILQRPRSV